MAICRLGVAALLWLKSPLRLATAALSRSRFSKGRAAHRRPK